MLVERRAAEAEALKKNDWFNRKIIITLPDGATREGIANVTTPLDIAAGISKKLAEKVSVARVQWVEAEKKHLLTTNVVDADDEGMRLTPATHSWRCAVRGCSRMTP